MEMELPVKREKGGPFTTGMLKVFDGKETLAVLATRDEEGRPYVSLISFAFTEDLGSVIFATPRNTRKYRNLLRTKEVALLIDNRTETGGDSMITEAITILGKAKAVRRGKTRNDLEAIFLRKHPRLRDFVRFPSTALVLLDVEECVYVSRFQAVSVWKKPR